MASKIKVNLDTNKENYLVAKCKQNDDIKLEATIYENGLEKDLTSAEIMIQALKADNTYIIQDTDISKENNIIIANLNRDFTRISGKTKIEIVLLEEGKQNTTFDFDLSIRKSVIDGNIESKNIATILEDLTNCITQALIVKTQIEDLIEGGGVATDVELNNAVTDINNIIIPMKNELTSTTTKANAWDNFKTNGVLGVAGYITGGSTGVTIGKNGVIDSRVATDYNTGTNKLYPLTNNVMDLGGVSNRFKNLYLAGFLSLPQSINTTTKYLDLYTIDNKGLRIDTNNNTIYPSNDKVFSLGTSNNKFTDIYVGDFIKNTNGYTKLTNGLILQWGVLTNHIDGEVIFPIPFPNSLLFLGGNINNSADNWGGDLNFQRNTNLNNFRVVVLNKPNGTYTVNWFALGF